MGVYEMSISAAYQRILASQVKPAAVPHTPAFRVERARERWRVYDGARDLADVYDEGFLDIWSFSPVEADVKFNLTEPDKVIDLHTLVNTVLSLGSSAWPEAWKKHIEASGGMRQALQWQWLQDHGDALRFRAAIAGPDGESGRWAFSITYDPAWGRYRYAIDIEARKLQFHGFECFNLMMAGALGERAESRRWTHSLWSGLDGSPRRIVHSNALFTGTDYASHPDGQWRSHNLPFQQAWFGYAAHDLFNPMVVIHDNNVPLWGATCSQLFDEHLVWSNAGNETLEADGYFHFRTTLELVNVPYSLAQELLDAAPDPVLPTAWRYRRFCLPFELGVVNDLEAEAEPMAPQTCPLLAIDPESSTVAWVDDEAHRGSRSIRLTGTAFHHRAALAPGGAVFRIGRNERYRFSAFVKTRAVHDGACLELYTYRYGYGNITRFAVSEDVQHDTDWTSISVELATGGEAYVMPRLVLKGAGDAWFDDLELVRLPQATDTPSAE